VHLLDNQTASGSGILIFDHCDPLIAGNTIRNNRAAEVGGGLAISTQSDPLVLNNLIVKNECIGNNGLDGAGGGVGVTFDSRPVFINNTIANNSAGWGGGLFFNRSSPIFINTIIANNQDTDDPNVVGSQIGTYNMSAQTLNFHNSCLEGGKINIYWYNGVKAHTVNFVESIVADPDLQSNYKLEDTSPCISAGTMSCEISGTTYNAPSYDLAGNDRPMPAYTDPDMGAFEEQITVDINDESIMPAKFSLYQNYPNPFNPITTFSYDLPYSSNVNLSIYDISGRLVETLINQHQNTGSYTSKWNASEYSSGIYFYRLQAGDFVDTKKMVFMK